MNQNDLHFSSCRELPYIDYYQGAAAKKQSIAVEVMTPLYLDGQRISTLISSPEDIDVLAVGYCLAEEKIPAGRKLAGVCLHDGAAWVTTETGTARAVEKPPFVPITAEKLYSYGGLLDSLSTAHHASHGVHEGALVQGDEVLVYTEDIGRHNVLDRLLRRITAHRRQSGRPGLQRPRSPIGHQKDPWPGRSLPGIAGLADESGRVPGGAVPDYPVLRLAA